MVPVNDKHCVVLMSGGIDSSATLATCQEPGISLSGMFVDYGQPAARSEWEAAQRIASHYQIEIDKVDLGISLLGAVLVLVLSAWVPVVLGFGEPFAASRDAGERGVRRFQFAYKTWLVTE